jgi:hypothetical protein
MIEIFKIQTRAKILQNTTHNYVNTHNFVKKMQEEEDRGEKTLLFFLKLGFSRGGHWNATPPPNAIFFTNDSLG